MSQQAIYHRPIKSVAVAQAVWDPARRTTFALQLRRKLLCMARPPKLLRTRIRRRPSRNNRVTFFIRYGGASLNGTATFLECVLDSKEIYNLLVREMDAVYRLAYHLTSQPQEVEDLVQETYYRAFKAADGFKLGAFGPRPWLFKILHNLISSHYTSKRRETNYLETLQHEPAPDASSVSAPLSHTDMSWDTVDQRLKQALDALPVTSRIAFLLYAVEDLKYREIAEVTGVPVGTVMSRLWRAREELVKRLGDYPREQGWSTAGRSNRKRSEEAPPPNEESANDSSVPKPEGPANT